MFLRVLSTHRVRVEQQLPATWWRSHFMAPAPVLSGEELSIYVGGWDERGISRIGRIDVDVESPFVSTSLSSIPVLDLGRPGTFDENGVFPASVVNTGVGYYLAYTGFQLGAQVPHFNFGGLAKLSLDGWSAERTSEVPHLDRQDDGLFVRAGFTSLQLRPDQWLQAFAAGSAFEHVGGKLRPTYDIYTRVSDQPFDARERAKVAVRFDRLTEHAVGRPQLVHFGGRICLLYTRRLRSMRYRPGLAVSEDNGDTFVRMDHLLDAVGTGQLGFDDQMVYFPGPVVLADKLLVYYSGNAMGAGGLGVSILAAR